MKRKTIVIKQGGSSLELKETQRELASLVHGLRAAGHRVVVVHGGGPAINRGLMERRISWTFVDGQRRTSPEMMEVIEQVLARDINGMVVRGLEASGIGAVGLSGAAGILRCELASENLGLVGQVQDVEPGAILGALKCGAVPVVAPLGVGPCGERLNVNADWAAARIAVALSADELVFLTDQDGVLGPTGRLVARATPADLLGSVEGGSISGGMRTKVLAMIDALESGVARVRVLNARQASRILARCAVGTTLARPKIYPTFKEANVYAS